MSNLNGKRIRHRYNNSIKFFIPFNGTCKCNALQINYEWRECTLVISQFEFKVGSKGSEEGIIPG